MKIIDLSRAIEILKTGGVIAYPTETFYGLGCDATRADAVQKLFDLKGRASNVAIPVLIGEIDQLANYVREVPAVAEKLIEEFWPGPLTLIFWAKELFPKELLAGSEKIAIRLSSHPIAKALAKNFGLPLTTTSANASGSPAASNIAQVEKYFGNRIDGVIEGQESHSIQASTIVDVTVNPPKIVREGVISSQRLNSIIQFQTTNKEIQK